MRGKTAEAIAVRDPYGKIQVESKRLPENKGIAYKIPVLRGVMSFINSLIGGSEIIMRSGEVYGEDIESEPSKADKWLQKNLKIDTVKLATYIGLVLGLVLAVGLFIIIPTLIKNFVFGKLIDLSSLGAWDKFIENLTLGVVRILIFIGYLLAVSSMKEIKRLFAYHGAEHKTIACYEAGEELTPENVKKHSRLHDRCGTNFMFIVMMVSILFFAIFFALIKALSGWSPSKQIYEILIRIGALPLIAGLSYEALKLLAKFDNFFVKLLKAPGRGLQLITTREPDEAMIEVAIAAFNTVLALEQNPDMPTTKFRTSVMLKKLLSDMKEINPLEHENEEIIMCTLGYKNRSMIKGEKPIYKDIGDKMIEICRKRVETKEPLQYLLGKANFYGLDFSVDRRVLIPRFDTEILVEKAINEIGDKEVKVLDMCSGSGAIGITVALNTKASVTCSDISLEALEVSKKNALDLGANITFIASDLFQNVEGKFDFILANPPYIPSKDILTLESEVKDYEPILALDGGENGMDVYARIASKYKNYLTDDGVLMLEIGVNQKEDIEKLFGKVEFIKDYNNPPIDRVAIIRKGE